MNKVDERKGKGKKRRKGEEGKKGKKGWEAHGE